MLDDERAPGRGGTCKMGSGQSIEWDQEPLPRRRVVELLATAGSLLTLAACGSGSSDWSGETFPPYRYKLTAEVETPQGVRSGSSVIQVQWFTKPKVLGPMGGGGFQVTGEAVAVDVAPGQTLFVLLSSRTDSDWPAYAAGVFGQVADMRSVSRAPQQLWYPKGDPRGKHKPNIPYLVRFRDIRNPATVEQVDPNDLSKSFGVGVKFKALTLRITDDEVTTGLNRRLTWLNGPKLMLVNLGRKLPPGVPYPFGTDLSTRDFIREDSK